MNTVVLLREYRMDCTVGHVVLPSGRQINSLERPWLSNRRNISCIPEGVYDCAWLERSGSGRYQRCWHVLDVPGRSGILWHTGNVMLDTNGCIMPGMTFGRLNVMTAVLSSLVAMNIMRSELENQDFKLIIAELPRAKR